MARKVLVAVDSSPCAKKAFDAAVAMVAAASDQQQQPPQGTVLYILTMVQPLRVLAGPGRKEAQRSLESLIEKDAKVLLADYATMAEIKGVKAETILAKGRQARVIVDITRAKRAEMMAIGSRGLGSVRGVIFGSVSNAVLQNSKVPVLVAK